MCSDLANLFNAMERHGDLEGTETQLGDALAFFGLAWAYMTPKQRDAFMADDTVTEFFQRLGLEET